MKTYQMEKDFTFDFMLSSFALLIPFPGRLAYGIILVLLLNIQMLSITLFRKFVEFLQLNDLLSVLTAAMLICESIIFKQLLALYSPITALTLSFVIYLPAVSSFIISRLYFSSDKDKIGKANAVGDNFKHSLFFSAYAMLFFLIRDIFGYGTISLPGRSSLISIRILPEGQSAHVGVFFASIPGSILIVFLSLFLIWHIRRKFEVAGGSSNDALS